MLHSRPGFLALILLVSALALLVWRCRYAWQRAVPSLPKRIRRLHPSTPDDCPHCRPAVTLHQELPASSIRPWGDGGNHRGAPRQVPTDGYAYRKSECTYFGIIVGQSHALVADGHQGRTDRIQQFRCQACGANVSARWGTALAHLKTPPRAHR